MSQPSAAVVAAPFAKPRSNNGKLIFVALTLAAAIVLAWVLIPRTGSLMVTAAGPGKKPIESLEVLIDGEKRCDRSPCRVEELSAGTHLVLVKAPGYQPTAAEAVKIEPNDEAVRNLTLIPSSEGTGLRVLSEGTGLKLSVDGKEVGPLPQELKDMSPGQHQIRIDGSDRYEPYEETISVVADKMLNLEPKLKVLKGLVTIKAGQNADDARVYLVSGRERRPIPKLPIKIEVAVDKEYSIVATQRGYETFTREVSFGDGEAEKTYVIDLEPAATSATPPPTRPSDTGQARPQERPPQERPPQERPTPAAASDKGILNLSSVPPSNVILDGRPLGSTPKSVRVDAGVHTVVFIHPEHGRKVKSVNVTGGKTAAAVVRFP